MVKRGGLATDLEQKVLNRYRQREVEGKCESTVTMPLTDLDREREREDEVVVVMMDGNTAGDQAEDYEIVSL